VLQRAVVGKGCQKIDLIDVKNVTGCPSSNAWSCDALVSQAPGLARSLVKLFCVLRPGRREVRALSVLKE